MLDVRLGPTGGCDVAPFTHSAVAIALDYEASAANPVGCTACEPLPRCAPRNLSAIDATLLDGFTSQHHTLRAGDDGGWE